MEPAEFRVFVDGDPVPHHSAVGLRAVLVTHDGELAEVQVAKVGDGLSVAIAGDWDQATTREGHLIVRVEPTRK